MDLTARIEVRSVTDIVLDVMIMKLSALLGVVIVGGLNLEAPV